MESAAPLGLRWTGNWSQNQVVSQDVAVQFMLFCMERIGIIKYSQIVGTYAYIIMYMMKPGLRVLSNNVSNNIPMISTHQEC